MTGFLSSYLPTLAVCGLFYWWSRSSGVPWLAKLLRTSSLVGALYFLILLIAVHTIVAICTGGVFAGVTNCAPLPDIIGQIILSLALTSYAIAIFFALILVGAGGLVEALRPTPRD